MNGEPQLYVCGSGECDQLGIPGVDMLRRPRSLPFPEPISFIACGGMHTAALTYEGRLYTWGCDDDNALGRPGPAEIPQIVTSVGSVNMVTAGDSHTLALNTTTNALYMWGTYRDAMGQMTEQAVSPTLIGKNELGRFKQIMSIASGANHSLIVADGKAYAWGDSDCGQLARYLRSRSRRSSSLRIEGIGVKGILKGFCGGNHNFVLNNQGQILGWGLNNHGQLGLGHTTDQFAPVEVTALSHLGVKQITGGMNHTIILLQDGSVLGCGRNDDYQLGLGHTQDVHTPQVIQLSNIARVSTGSHCSYAVSNDNDIFGWGMNECYMMCNGLEDNIEEPKQLNSAKKFEQIDAGGQHVMLLSYSVPLRLPEQNGQDAKRKISIPDKGPTKRIKLDES